MRPHPNGAAARVRDQPRRSGGRRREDGGRFPQRRAFEPLRPSAGLSPRGSGARGRRISVTRRGSELRSSATRRCTWRAARESAGHSFGKQWLTTSSLSMPRASRMIMAAWSGSSQLIACWRRLVTVRLIRLGGQLSTRAHHPSPSSAPSGSVGSPCHDTPAAGCPRRPYGGRWCVPGFRECPTARSRYWASVGHDSAASA
jgi:hypothetical protein